MHTLDKNKENIAIENNHTDNCTDDINEEKIAEIKKMLESGSFTINHESLTDKILEFETAIEAAFYK